MGEDVETGGLMKFRYDKGSGRRMSDEERAEIRSAYLRAEERKARERRNRIIFWIVGIVIALAAGAAIFLSR